MLPQVTMPMGSSMGHVRNLDLSDLFLDIYHFYTKALLSGMVGCYIFMKNQPSYENIWIIFSAQMMTHLFSKDMYLRNMF